MPLVGIRPVHNQPQEPSRLTVFDSFPTKLLKFSAPPRPSVNAPSPADAAMPTPCAPCVYRCIAVVGCCPQKACGPRTSNHTAAPNTSGWRIGKKSGMRPPSAWPPTWAPRIGVGIARGCFRARQRGTAWAQSSPGPLPGPGGAIASARWSCPPCRKRACPRSGAKRAHHRRGALRTPARASPLNYWCSQVMRNEAPPQGESSTSTSPPWD